MARLICLRSSCAALLWLAACDVQHREQRQYCEHASPEQCRQRPDWCNALGGARCTSPTSGADVYCEPDPALRGCVLRDDRALRARCAPSSRWIAGGVLSELSAHAPMSFSEAVRTRAGRKLDRADVEALGEDDRRWVCDVTPGDACRLIFEPTLQQAQCAVAEDVCRASRLVVERERCVAKNLCSAVLCF